jgi:predicted nucleic acid-binding protein
VKVLADTSVWIDHFRSPDPQLIAGVAAGWIACLPAVQAVSTTALLAFIEQNDLPAKGVGFVDAHLLAAVSQSGSTRLWTRDKRLAQQAERLGLGANP